MKIVTVVGARPQFIKSSVVSQAFAQCDDIEEVLVHTGQHFDGNMSKVFFVELGMRSPKYNLGISGCMHGEMTGRMLHEVENVLMEERPDAVMVYGDTNSTLAGALAAVKLQIPVAHVEAGLRSFNMRMPEEVNRVLTDRISTWLFAPTEGAVANLLHEGIPHERIINVGDVMYDVALIHGKRAFSAGRGVLDDLALEDGRYVLATIHRAENTDDLVRLSVIVQALREVAGQIAVVWPLHPRTHDVLEKAGMLLALEKHLHIIDPQGYLDMVRLESSAAVIATDSGGVQKEAFFHNVPCVTLRDETEWVELVASGWNRLISPVEVAAVRDAILNSRGRRGENVQPYGRADASRQIFEKLRSDGAR